jgi:hypothetical protein
MERSSPTRTHRVVTRQIDLASRTQRSNQPSPNRKSLLKSPRLSTTVKKGPSETPTERNKVFASNLNDDFYRKVALITEELKVTSDLPKHSSSVVVSLHGSAKRAKKEPILRASSQSAR